MNAQPAAADAPFVEFRGVTWQAGGREVLRGVDLEVGARETLVLLGRSGSGKTSLLRMVNALLQPSAGEVRFEGRAVRDWDPIALRRRIGYVIQDGGLFPHRTVARNVGLVPELEGWPRERIDARVDALLRAVGLPPEQYAARRPRELSGGEKQRVGIARALAVDPPLLLLDEPFAALDPITRHDMQRHFLRLRDEFGTGALFVTHDLREALALATRIALLDAGRIVALGTPAEFRSEAFLRDAAPAARDFLRTLDPPAGSVP